MGKVKSEAAAPEGVVNHLDELEFKLRQAESTLKEYANTLEGKHRAGWVEQILVDIHRAIGKVKVL